jgi:phosphoserine phosphatase RsbX
MEGIVSSAVEWSFASRALPGESTSGDLQVVRTFPGGMLFAVLDGVGHGSEAATAAALAQVILEANAADPVVTLVQRCHEALRTTRGVAMSIASLSLPQKALTWLGVGNVEGILLRKRGARGAADASLLLRAGVVGLRLPALEAEEVSLSEGDTLIFATDGIQSNFICESASNRTAQGIAENILTRHGKSSDDALVLVARFFSDRHEGE